MALARVGVPSSIEGRGAALWSLAGLVVSVEKGPGVCRPRVHGRASTLAKFGPSSNTISIPHASANTLAELHFGPLLFYPGPWRRRRLHRPEFDPERPFVGGACTGRPYDHASMMPTAMTQQRQK